MKLSDFFPLVSIVSVACLTLIPLHNVEGRSERESGEAPAGNYERQGCNKNRTQLTNELSTIAVTFILERNLKKKESYPSKTYVYPCILKDTASTVTLWLNQLKVDDTHNSVRNSKDGSKYMVFTSVKAQVKSKTTRTLAYPVTTSMLCNRTWILSKKSVQNTTVMPRAAAQSDMLSEAIAHNDMRHSVAEIMPHDLDGAGTRNAKIQNNPTQFSCTDMDSIINGGYCDTLIGELKNAFNWSQFQDVVIRGTDVGDSNSNSTPCTESEIQRVARLVSYTFEIFRDANIRYPVYEGDQLIANTKSSCNGRALTVVLADYKTSNHSTPSVSTCASGKCINITVIIKAFAIVAGFIPDFAYISLDCTQNISITIYVELGTWNMQPEGGPSCVSKGPSDKTAECMLSRLTEERLGKAKKLLTNIANQTSSIFRGNNFIGKK